MFFKMFIFEWQYFTRQVSFYITSLIFFGFGFLAPSAGLSSLGNVAKNSPYVIAFILIFLSIFSMFLVVNFVANTALRNETSNMSEVLFCKPFNQHYYQLGRFLGSLALVVTVFSLVPIGFLLGSYMPWIDESRIVPTQLSFYLTAFFYLSVPTLFVLSSIFYSLATYFKSMKVVYLSVIALFILNEVSESLLLIPELNFLSVLLDPFALNTFLEVTHDWTPIQKNNQVLIFDGLLMTNRLTWIAIGSFILIVFGGFSRQLVLHKKKQNLDEKSHSIKLKDVSNKKSFKQPISSQHKEIANANWHNFVARTKLEIKQVIFDPAFYILCILSLVLLLSMLFTPEGLFGNNYWPVTQKMVGLIQGGMSVLSLIIITYYSAELIWRERESGIGDIIDSLPVTNMSFWISKLVAVWLILTLLL